VGRKMANAHSDIDDGQKGLENFILLVIGANNDPNKPLSLLHLHKEVFLIWNYHPSIQAFLQFIKHRKGPYSPDIEKIALHPFHLKSCWEYSPPKKWDKISGGFLVLTEKGREEYNILVRDVIKDPQLSPLLSAINMVRDLYDEFSPEELLLLVYDTYPEYKEYSDVSYIIENRKETLAKSMLKRGLIDDERFNELIGLKA
jgi:hypothetical protein